MIKQFRNVSEGLSSRLTLYDSSTIFCLKGLFTYLESRFTFNYASNVYNYNVLYG